MPKIRHTFEVIIEHADDGYSYTPSDIEGAVATISGLDKVTVNCQDEEEIGG